MSSIQLSGPRVKTFRSVGSIEAELTILQVFYAWVNCMAYLLEGAWILTRPLMGYQISDKVRVD
jgi:hypothetical protein